MSSKTITKVFPSIISDETIGCIISNLLRQEYLNSNSAIKQIAKKTDINLRTVEKWYNGLHVPKSAHLLLILKSFPTILEELLALIGRKDLVEQGRQKKPISTVAKKLQKESEELIIYTDKSVSINVSLDLELAEKLNERQLWFFGLIQKGHNIKAQNIVYVWKVAMRTANRDIARLIELNIIHFVGANKNGRYKIRW